MYDSLFDYKKKVVLEETPLFAPDTSTTGANWNCSITKYSLNAITMNVSTPKNGLLILSEIYFPAWKAMVDGKPVPLYLADYALRAIPIEKGNHEVSCYYSTEVFNKGLVLSVLSLLATLGFLIGGILSKRKIPRSGPSA
jgi:uncharacterized membrane protein YfhO